MQQLFSTEGIHPRNAFQRWQDVICGQFAPVNLRPLDDAPFQGRIEFAAIGSLLISRSAHSAMRTEVTPESIRRNKRPDQLIAIFNLSGRDVVQQGDSETVTQPGDFVVFDGRPIVAERQRGGSLVLELPRRQIESVLGPARLFSALPVEGNRALTRLASTYIRDLIRVGDQLTPEGAARMATIAGDLLVASLADRLAQEIPRSVQGNATVQRAKAYIEANLCDLTLDPPALAAAMGLSLRRLQELFHERGRHISDYIWDRRLEAAARRLADPACAHLSIGMLAYGCGFASQAHFARRFRNRHGVTPRDYRTAACAGVP